MPNVNLFELSSCLDSLLSFMERFPRKPYAEHTDRIRRVRADFRTTLAQTDADYTHWRLGVGQGMSAFKQMQAAFKQLQARLQDEGAVGWPEAEVKYLEAEQAAAVTLEMIGFLQEHQEALDFGESEAARLIRLLEGALQEDRDESVSMDKYLRASMGRKLVMEQAIELIQEVRPLVRRDLGREHPDYQGISWPATVAPDPM